MMRHNTKFMNHRFVQFASCFFNTLIRRVIHAIQEIYKSHHSKYLPNPVYRFWPAPLSVTAQVLADNPYALPELPTFAQSVENGRSNELRGVYIEGIFELKVIQQPDNNPTYVAPVDNVITQFGPASQLGNVGLLAHERLSGSLFSMLCPAR